MLYLKKNSPGALLTQRTPSGETDAGAGADEAVELPNAKDVP